MRTGPPRKLTAEAERDVAARYRSGESIRQISRALKLGSMTIQRTLARLGVESRCAGRSLSDEERARAVEMVASGTTLHAVAEHLDVDRKTVMRVLHDHGVVLHTGRPPRQKIDHAAFDFVTPESAYWIGFLFADGCVHHDGEGAAVIAVGLAEIDRGHLEKFRFFLRSTHAITRAEPGRQSFGGPCCYFRVRSERLARALAQHGFVAKKAERAPGVELQDSRDFWRGMIDGDGWLGQRSGFCSPHIGFCGQRAIVSAFAAFARHHVGANLRPTRTQSGVFRVQTESGRARRLIEALYANATISLDRKALTAKEILGLS